MHNEPLVSIIIPVYNVEKYLKRCVDSVLSQTYKTLEIILVDDGSTDNCGKICDAYLSCDTRIYVIHKKNGGLSDARNYGIKAAHGDYVFFLDSDDWIRNDCIQVLIKHAIEKKADVVISKYITVSDESKPHTKKNHVSVVTLDKITALSCLLYQKNFSTSAWGKLYKISIIEKFAFPVGKLFEDVETIFKVIESSEQIVFLNEILYYYFGRTNSITKSDFDIRKMDYVDACTNVYKYVHNHYPQLEKAAISRLVWSEIYVIVHMDDFSEYEDVYTKVWEHIKKYRLYIMCDTKNNLNCRVICALSFFGSNFLKKLYDFMN